MIPIYRQNDIKSIDAALASAGMLEMAIAHAGFSVFTLAIEMLGGPYGKRVAVLHGPGNNGRDGLVAAELLRGAGVSVKEVVYGGAEYSDACTYSEMDLVIDGCFGIGLSRPFKAPPIGPEINVLAIDVPSGLAGDEGKVLGSAVKASATLCLTGIKLGVLISHGPDLCGDIYLAELGLGDPGLTSHREYLVDDFDLAQLGNLRSRTDHKWSHSVAVIAGSPGMDGAAHLVCDSAYFMGAGIVHLYTDMGNQRGDYGVETVVHQTAFADFDEPGKRAFFHELAHRFKSLVIGPGLGREPWMTELIEGVISCGLRTVIDADGIAAVPSIEWLASRIASDHPGVILTPHQGELRSLLERSGGKDAVDDLLQQNVCSFAGDFAAKSRASLLLKGGPTVVASREGACYLTSAPSASLAVAGSGDTLSGMLGAVLSYQGDMAKQAAITAHLHGLAGRSLSRGLSGDLARRARDILLRFEASGKSHWNGNLQRPTQIEGNLVAGKQLVVGYH
ncbi:MAG: NAD(P)H-hydrate dehydratase [Actinomycetota bacterium]|nr:MAG: NAD(P)H-hydrate dehydratase [Actinomycetota bacterium]